MSNPPLTVTLLHQALVEGSSNENDVASQLYPLRLWQIGDAIADPVAETIVIVHGRRSELPDRTQPINLIHPRLFALATTLAQSPETQVLFLDGSEALTDSSLPPYAAAGRIQMMADWASTVLPETSELTVIGHSLGSYVAAEIAAQVNADQLIALDPAFPGSRYDIDGLIPDQQPVRNFLETLQDSLAFVVADGLFQVGLAGDNNQAGTAQTSLVVEFSGLFGFFDAAEAHNAVIDLYADISRYLSPSTARFNRIWQQLTPNRYNNAGDRTDGLHEGIAYADRNELGLWQLDWVDGDGTNLYFLSNTLSNTVDSTLAPLDNDSGEDIVVSLVDTTLMDGFDQLILGGTDDLNGIGNDENNALWGNDGNNQLSGQSGRDSLWGRRGIDILNGGDAMDVLRGNLGNDVLRGGNAADLLMGGMDDDILWGDRGRDQLAGEHGADIFVLQKEIGMDTILDFQPTIDKLGLGADIDITDINFVQRPTGTLLRADEFRLALLVNISISDLSSDDFVVV